MGNNFEQYKQNEWGILEKNKRIEVIGSLDEALNSKNVNSVEKILQDPKLLETLIKDRGVENENFSKLEDSFMLLFHKRFGKEADIFNTDPREIIDFVHKSSLPEQVLLNLSDIAFHTRNKVFLDRMANVILKNQDLFLDDTILERMRHSLATYEIVTGGDLTESYNINKEIKKTSDNPIMQVKAEYGTKLVKGLKPKEKAKDFMEIANNFKALKYEPDAFRAQIEEAKARIELSGRQKKASHTKDSEDNLKRAYELAEKAHEYAIESGYSNLEVLAQETMAEASEIMGDKIKFEEHSELAKKARNESRYQTGKY